MILDAGIQRRKTIEELREEVELLKKALER